MRSGSEVRVEEPRPVQFTIEVQPEVMAEERIEEESVYCDVWGGWGVRFLTTS